MSVSRSAGPPQRGQRDDTDEDDGKTATFPFLNRLFNQNPPPAQDAAAAASEPPHADGSAADKRGAAPR